MADTPQASIEPHLLPHLLVGEQQTRMVRPVHLLLVIWLCAVAAAAGPAWQREAAPFLNDDAGLMILLKTSTTMESTDVQPSRLERATQKIRDIMALRKGGSTGLIVYSGSAHLVMPLTRDDRIITALLEDMSSELMPADGDRLSAAVMLGQQLVEQSGVPGSLLIIADSAAERTFASPALPVQVLAVQAFGMDPDQGLVNAAQGLKGALTRLSPDHTDVEQIVERAETDHRNVSEPGQGERWQDGGYMLLPLIAAGLLMWFRKGWVIR